MEIVRSDVVFGDNDEVVTIVPRVIKRTRQEAIDARNMNRHEEPKGLIERAREVKMVGSRLQVDACLASLDHNELERKYGKYEVKVTLNKEDKMYYICIL